MKNNQFDPKPLTAKKAEIIVDYLNLKLSNFTDGLNYWGREAGNINNTVQRNDECIKNISHLKSAYDEVYSMFIQLKADFNIL